MYITVQTLHRNHCYIDRHIHLVGRRHHIPRLHHIDLLLHRIGTHHHHHWTHCRHQSCILVRLSVWPFITAAWTNLFTSTTSASSTTSTSKIDFDTSSIKLLFIHIGNCTLCVGVGAIGHKSKSTRTTCVTITHDNWLEHISDTSSHKTEKKLAVWTMTMMAWTRWRKGKERFDCVHQQHSRTGKMPISEKFMIRQDNSQPRNSAVASSTKRDRAADN